VTFEGGLQAPWNIVFVGGGLAYIDQDTQDKTFDDAVPRAYQVPLRPLLVATYFCFPLLRPSWPRACTVPAIDAIGT
jgi:hypothetical protein